MNPNSVPIEQALSQLEFWLNAPWPMSEAEAAELATDIGWSVEDEEWLYARNNPVSFQMVLGISKRDNETVSFSFSLTDDVRRDDAEGMEALKDRYSEFVAAGRARWGKPALKRGKRPSASWDFGDRGGVRIYYDSAVVASFVTPADVQLRKDLNDW